MSPATPSTSLRIRDRLAGQHILITGSTGFLAKAFVEKLLRSVDTVGGLHLLVRPRSDGVSPRDRVWKEVLRSRVYDRLRASLGEGFARLCEEKIHVVGGDLTKERLGFDGATYRALSKRMTLVVNSAATVTFDERLDEAVALNTLGPSRLLKFARDCGNAPFMHVSTCYVCGVRKGVVVEDFSAPEPARGSLPRRKDNGQYDLDAIVQAMIGEAEELRLRFGADTETCRRQLIDAGMRWARSHGWNDTYTFTKWIGEQLLVRDRREVPLVIFRPAIIEGSFDEPTPGWIDGLRMADPIIVAYGRGKLNEFPGREDIAIDLIPVDFVANAMIAALPAGLSDLSSDPHKAAGITVFQCASSDRNPFAVGRLRQALERAFEQRPMNGDDGRPIHPGRLRLIDRESFIERWEAKQQKVARYRKWLRRLGFSERRLRKLSAIARQIEQVVYFAKIYSPYTHLDCRFADDGLRQVAERLHPEDRELLPFDAKRIDWDDYIINRHVPGLLSFVLGTGSEPSARIRGMAGWDDGRGVAETIGPGETIFSVFERTAGRLATKPALQIRREGRWVRYTFDEALRATGTIMRRFLERGLLPGDRVAICAENGPEWGLAYLAVMRAGMTAVPLDPQLPPAEAWAAARFARARLMCAGVSTFDDLSVHRGEEDVELVKLREPFIPPAGASRDPEPDPVAADDSSIASILFTSGTTIAPKAVPLTHRNLLANASALLRVHPIRPADEMLSVLPLYHAFEFTGGFLVPMVCGATVTYVDQLKGAEILAAMQATGTTIMLAVPRLLKMFYDSIEGGVASSGLLRRGLFRLLGFASDLTGHRFGRRLFRVVHKRFGGRLRMFVSGGSRLDPELFRAFKRVGFVVYEGYGLTETSPVLTVNPPGSSRAGSVGPPLPNVELAIRNQNLEGIGEVWARGPSVMSGYIDDSESTAEVMIDGWLRTGDLGKRDEDGFLHLTGRSKDLIITGAGKNVYPDEVEVRYKDLPYTKELCVFGLPAEDGLGDTVCAVSVVDEAAAPELDRSSIEREIRLAAETIGESLPPHQRITVLHFWYRDLPKTSTMKAKRGVIRDVVASKVGVGEAVALAMAGGAAGARRDEKVDEVLAAVRRILSKQSKRPESAIHRDTHLLLDLGIDSIGKVDLIGSVEAQFSMRIDDKKAAAIARVSDLLHVIGDRLPIGGGTRGEAWRRLMANSSGSRDNGHIPASLRPARWLVRGTVSVFMNTYVRVEVRGREHIPATGPFILTPNHCSHLDSPSVVTAVGGKRRVWVAGAEDYFFDTTLKRFLFGKLLDTIAFDRQADGLSGLRRCGEALSRGDGLLLFPEGTRSRDGRLQPFKVGAAVLAMEQRAPIVPVHIDRTYELLPKGRRLVRPGVVKVRFGPPIRPPENDALTDHYAALQAMTRRVQAAVEALAKFEVQSSKFENA
jgi:long-chain acyl-CoA synthetase